MNPPVLLTVAGYYGTLAAARCLGRHGISVAVADPGYFAPASWSRFAARRLRCPAMDSSEGLVDWLVDFGRREPGHVLLPTSDELAWLMSRHRDDLSPYFRMQHPGLATTQALLSKKQLADAGQRAGLQAPLSLFPTNEAEFEALVATVPLPVLIKPVTQVLLASHLKGSPVTRREDLRAAYHAFQRENAYPPAVLNTMPEAAWPFLQAFRPEAATDIHSVSGYLPQGGDPVVLGARKLMQRPRKLGIGLCFEAAPVRPELVDGLHRLGQEVGFSGLFEAEFIETAEGPLLIDFNPRFYSQMAFDIDRGMPLPYFAYLAATGRQTELEAELEKTRASLAAAAERVYVHRLILEVLTRAQGLSGRMSRDEVAQWRSWLRDHAGHISDAVVDTDDRWPTVVDWAGTLLAYGLHPRSFLRRMVFEK